MLFQIELTLLCPLVHVCTGRGRKIQTSPILTILGRVEKYKKKKKKKKKKLKKKNK